MLLLLFLGCFLLSEDVNTHTHLQIKKGEGVYNHFENLQTLFTQNIFKQKRKVMAKKMRLGNGEKKGNEMKKGKN